MLLQEVAWDEGQMILYPLSHHLAQTSHEWKLSITTRVKDLISWRSHKATYFCSMARKKMAGIMVKTLEPNSEFIDSGALYMYLWLCNYRSWAIITIILSCTDVCPWVYCPVHMYLMNFRHLMQNIWYLKAQSVHKTLQSYQLTKIKNRVFA